MRRFGLHSNIYSDSEAEHRRLGLVEEHGRIHHLWCRSIQWTALWQTHLLRVQTILVSIAGVSDVRECRSFVRSFVLGIRSRLPINQHNENVSLTHIRCVSTQAIVRMKSRMICYRGYSRISRKKPTWLAFNKCGQMIISCLHLQVLLHS